jgi:hypothetical protein
MDSQNYTLGAQNLNVTVTEISGGRRVSATAGLQAPTIFLSLIGLKTMDVSARSAAIQSAGKIEITLVLDVSGSMGWDSTSAEGTKLAQLKIAAKDFIDTILAGDNPTQILISIVPFSQQVALPRTMADLYNLNRTHDYSSCFDYHSINFGTTTMPTNPATAYDQGQHFRENVGSGNFGCPKINNIITPFSNNPTALKAAIEALSPETWTATYMGMKWGTHLLDPSSRPVVSALIASNTLPGTFAGWPHAWDDTSARKITVLMSDGQNTRLNEIVDAVYVQETPEYWNSNNPGSGEKISIINSEATGEGDVILDQICTQAKLSETATVYTVGFELGDQPIARAALEACSSALSTHYLVEGSEIQTAFQNIAGEIVDLKLIN